LPRESRASLSPFANACCARGKRARASAWYRSVEELFRSAGRIRAVSLIDICLRPQTPAPSPFRERGRGEGESHHHVIPTLRADFYAHLAQYPNSRGGRLSSSNTSANEADELRRAIEEPAKHGGGSSNRDYDLVLRDVGDEPGALPLLSHALLEHGSGAAGERSP